MRYWILGIFALAFCLFLGAQEQPAPPADAPAPPALASPAHKPRVEEGLDKSLQANFFLGEILKVDLEKNILELTVTAEDGTSETKRLKMDPKIRLFNRGSSLALKDLKSGTRVRVLYNLPNEGDLPVAKRIVVKPPDLPNAKAKPGGTGN